MDDYDLIYKIVLIGDSAVGKSNILYNITNREFIPDSKSTIGVEFGIKTFNISNKRVKAQIWDTAGQERYRAISTAYYRRAAGIILVFDITREQSFLNLERWMNELKEHSENPVILIVGNKTDLDFSRAVTIERVTDFCEEHGFSYIETSAKTGNNIEQAFTSLMVEILQKDTYKLTEPAKIDIISLNSTPLVNPSATQAKPSPVCNC